MLIVELKAVTVFWELTLNLLDDGNDLHASLPILQRRMEAEVKRYGAHSEEAAKAHGQGNGSAIRLPPGTMTTAPPPNTRP